MNGDEQAAGRVVEVRVKLDKKVGGKNCLAAQEQDHSNAKIARVLFQVVLVPCVRPFSHEVRYKHADDEDNNKNYIEYTEMWMEVRVGILRGKQR